MIREIALAGAFAFYGLPAIAQESVNTSYAKPRAIKAFAVGEQRLEMHALTRRTRADTLSGRDHLEECRAMSKIMPGYPQPAFVTVGLRLKF